ncbi:MAG: M3 family metallopeptidase [Bacteroidales bacterium]|jgi:peptidyl-dipeptidase Dcp|nr:M3 family metallopeptidase [Bacteroidales bacterium]
MKVKVVIVCCLAAGMTVSSCRHSSPKNSMNPLLQPFETPFGVPAFDRIGNEHYLPAVEAGISDHLEEIKAIAGIRKPTFENVIAAYDRSGEILRNVLPVFYGISSANTSEELEKINETITPLLSGHYDNIYLNAELFDKIKSLYGRKDALGLDDEQSRLLEETYRSFVRNGADLSADDKLKLRELNRDISVLQLNFRQNLLAETNAFQLTVEDEKQLSGLPEIQKHAAAEAAKAAGKQGWLFTLHNPSIMPFLQFADNRELRKQLLEAYLNRGNNNNAHDNKEIVTQLVSKRLEKAKLLKYINYADYALSNRMAKTSENVYTLLYRIWTPALKKAQEEAAEMQRFINKSSPSFELEAWDWRYYSEKVMKNKFDLNEASLRPYFRLENVREGIFWVANRLYGITFTELTDLPKYHEEVVAYECKDADGTHLGILYLDFFPRPGKRGGAWCGTYRDAIFENGQRIAPVTTIVCNFTRPSGETPALLSPDEVETFFHEFGHALHNLFLQVHYYGTSDVPRDFVELPSQIMEHWAFQPEVLKQYAKHYRTGTLIPDDLVEKMQKSSKFGQGFATAEYMAASFLDMDYHILTNTDSLDVLKFEKESMDKLGLIRQIPPRYRTAYFNHTMGGGYTAGYYSYIWAEVLDADAFQAFVETGDIFDKATATSFRKEILEKGGIYDAMLMYFNFRGAEPQINALLENRGLK